MALLWWGRRERTDEVSWAATALGLEGDPGSPEGAIGWLEGIEVSLRVALDAERKTRVVELRGPASADAGASIALGPATGGKEGPTGDPAFDAVVAVRSPPPLWLAAADPLTRSVLA